MDLSFAEVKVQTPLPGNRVEEIQNLLYAVPILWSIEEVVNKGVALFVWGGGCSDVRRQGEEEHIQVRAEKDG